MAEPIPNQSRTNPEAIGSEMHPFQFEMDGIHLNVPNPVTWSVMKLTATSDRWASSQDLKLDEESRDFSREQAAKHAQDVFRLVAMTTMEERDRAGDVVASIEATDTFRIAAESWQNHFADDAIAVVQQVKTNWLADDAATILDVLSGWFEAGDL